MAKIFSKDKVVQKQVCEKCKQTIRHIGLYMNGKRRSVKECGCGLFVNEKKVN